MNFFAIAVLLYLIIVPTLRGVIVYRDAKAHHIDPPLWTVAAAFVPCFVGFVIYFVVSRSTNTTTCTTCGRGFNANYNNCPYCGTPTTFSPKPPRQKMSTLDTVLWAALILCMLSPFVLFIILAFAANMQ